MIHSFVIGLTLSITSGSEFSECTPARRPFQSDSGRCTHVSFPRHRRHVPSIIQGSVTGYADSNTSHQIPNPSSIDDNVICNNGTNWNRGRTPVVCWSLWRFVLFVRFPTPHIWPSLTAKMKLTRGVMAAVSAGMLIYAASVEMLAGDFIMDPSLWKSGVGRQALAPVSLLVGAGAMAVIRYAFSTFETGNSSDESSTDGYESYGLADF